MKHQARLRLLRRPGPGREEPLVERAAGLRVLVHLDVDDLELLGLDREELEEAAPLLGQDVAPVERVAALRGALALLPGRRRRRGRRRRAGALGVELALDLPREGLVRVELLPRVRRRRARRRARADHVGPRPPAHEDDVVVLARALAHEDHLLLVRRVAVIDLDELPKRALHLVRELRVVVVRQVDDHRRLSRRRGDWSLVVVDQVDGFERLGHLVDSEARAAPPRHHADVDGLGCALKHRCMSPLRAAHLRWNRW